MKLPRRLKQVDIELLIAAAVESGLLEIERYLRLDGIDTAVVLSLKIGSNPLEQFQLDLHSLGQVTAGRNEEAALVTFLRNAASQLRLRKRPQEKTFEQYASMICGAETKEEIHPPPFVLAGLVDGADVTFVPIPLASSTRASGLFFLSSSPVPIGNDEDTLSVETDRPRLIRWLSRKSSSVCPIRPPRPSEWNAALVAGNESGSVPPISLPRVTDGRSVWCLEDDRLLSRDYGGSLVDTGTADVWLIYELQR